MPATMLKNKAMYRQTINSVAFVRPFYLYFPDTPRILCTETF